MYHNAMNENSQLNGKYVVCSFFLTLLIIRNVLKNSAKYH